MYTHKTSRHTEVSRYYPEFPECQEIKRMCKQWIPGPFSDFSNGPGYEASLEGAGDELSVSGPLLNCISLLKTGQFI